MIKNYPKILIIGQSFGLQSGGGITMTNLFKGWDKDKIAVAGERIDNPDFTVCNKYYQLGEFETKRRFPFNLWEKKYKSGILHNLSSNVNLNNYSVNNYTSKHKELYIKLLCFFGMYHYSRRVRISSKFSSWLKEFSPGIIYSQLSSLELIRFVSDLHKTLNIPVVIHIMDDWPSIISKSGLLKNYWKKKIDLEFRSLLKSASLLMSISEAMSEEYFLRYNFFFIPFHNPIDTVIWTKYSKLNYNAGKPFVVYYAGRIGEGVKNCFFEIASAINILNNDGCDLQLILQFTNYEPIIEELKKFDFVVIKDQISYTELPQILSAADLLLLPNDFDRKSINFLKFSFPTKASEYMVTATPILVYSSPETALTKHALKHKWAHVINDNNIKFIAKEIRLLYENDILRTTFGKLAISFAVKNYDAKVIRYNFQDAIKKIVL